MEQINILLADDHEIFRKGLELTLKRIPYIEKVYHAENGKEVLDLVRTTPSIDIIILDIRMPEMDGIEATRQIRMHYKDLKILALSMMDDKASIYQMFKAGANGYLLKNTNKLELQEAIEKVMAGKKYFAREVSEIMVSSEFDYTPMPQRTYINTELSSREMDVLHLICLQYSTREISEMLAITEKTVEGHRKMLLEKTSSKNIAGLVWYAIHIGLIRNGGQ